MCLPVNARSLNPQPCVLLVCAFEESRMFPLKFITIHLLSAISVVLELSLLKTIVESLIAQAPRISELGMRKV